MTAEDGPPQHELTAEDPQRRATREGGRVPVGPLYAAGHDAHLPDPEIPLINIDTYIHTYTHTYTYAHIGMYLCIFIYIGMN